MMTREQYIARVRDAALQVAVLAPAEREMLAGLKMVYGTGYGTGARGVTYYNAWQKTGHACSAGCNHDGDDSLIEICAFAEESLVQLAGTTIHEMAHALTGKGHGHDKDWRSACKRLGLRGMKAAGTQYMAAMFVPALRERLAAIPVPADGKVIGWNAGAGGSGLGGILAGLVKRVRPCSAGRGARGGKSFGVGSGSRLRKFVCECNPPVIVRASRDTLAATCDLCRAGFHRA